VISETFLDYYVKIFDLCNDVSSLLRSRGFLPEFVLQIFDPDGVSSFYDSKKKYY